MKCLFPSVFGQDFYIPFILKHKNVPRPVVVHLDSHLSSCLYLIAILKLYIIYTKIYLKIAALGLFLYYS